jgi:hypothetical protein
MKARLTILIALAGVLALALPAAAEDAPAKPEAKAAPAKPAARPIATDADAKDAVARFKRQFDTEDLDFQLEALIKLAKTHHPKVAAVLLKLMKNDEVEIQVEAMKSLGFQSCYTKKLERKISFWLDEKKFEPRVVAMTVRAIRRHDMRKHEELIIESMNSNDDEVAIEALRTLHAWKSYKSLRDILLLWEFYPNSGAWATGTVTVDTGADTATEQKLAKAKWKAKYGARAKRARPELVKVVYEVVNGIIGIEEKEKKLKRPEELRKWLSENKVLMRKHR